MVDRRLGMHQGLRLGPDSAYHGFEMSRRCCILALAALAGACGKDAEINVPRGTLAVGAYSELSWDDTCKLQALGGKIPAPPTCIPHVATELMELDSSDTTVAAIVPGSSVPLDDADSAGYYLLGVGPGQATLTFKARFDDGSVRQATAAIQVKAPDTIKIKAICSDNYPVSDVVLPAGGQISFTVEIYARTEQLVGVLPDAVTGDGVALEDLSFGDSPRPYVWQAPATPATVQLRSAYAPTVVGSLRAFTEEQVTDIGMRVSQDSYRNAFTQSERATGPASLSVSTTVIVDGKASCQALPAQFHSATPAVCSGDGGAMEWGTAWWGGEVSVFSEGICTLSASMPGLPTLATKSFPLFFVSDGLEVSTAGSCGMEGQTACQPGYLGVERCKSGAWIADLACPADQVCDLAPAASAGCIAGVPCARCRGLSPTGPATGP